MDTYRLRVKIADHEFEAEGLKEDVRKDFEAFLDRVKEATGAPSVAKTDIDAAILKAYEEKTKLTNLQVPRLQRSPEDPLPEELKALFGHDTRRKLISLRFPTQGDNRVQNALLLILYGFKRFEGKDEVLVTQLKDALEQSGLSIDRMDRIAMPLVRDGLVLKGGKAKGGKYRLTNLGIPKAEEVAKLLAEQIR